MQFAARPIRIADHELEEIHFRGSVEVEPVERNALDFLFTATDPSGHFVDVFYEETVFSYRFYFISQVDICELQQPDPKAVVCYDVVYPVGEVFLQYIIFKAHFILAVAYQLHISFKPVGLILIFILPESQEERRHIADIASGYTPGTHLDSIVDRGAVAQLQ